MADGNDSQNTLRDVLTANIQASQDGTLGQVEEAAPIQTSTQDQAAIDRARDEKGRFAPRESATTQQSDQAAIQADQAAAVVAEPALERPTTWKKDYLPIWDKLATGAPLTPEEARKLAEYSNQREKEYATGVSTYKTEAMKAKELQQALEPFMPELQQYNINPAQWIQNLGNAHRTLALGSQDQKVAMFTQMVKEYQVDLPSLLAHLGVGGEQAGQMAPVISQLMNEINQLKQGVNTVSSWREQQEQAQIERELAKFQDAEKYPHFEQVRGTMGQLLESGLASDLDTAYTKAVRMVDEVWQEEQERQAQALVAKNQQANQAAAAAKAKASAVSPRTSTPSGAVTTNDKKDVRSLLAQQIYAAKGGRV